MRDLQIKDFKPRGDPAKVFGAKCKSFVAYVYETDSEYIIEQFSSGEPVGVLDYTKTLEEAKALARRHVGCMARVRGRRKRRK